MPLVMKNINFLFVCTLQLELRMYCTAASKKVPSVKHSYVQCPLTFLAPASLSSRSLLISVNHAVRGCELGK